MNLLTIIIIKKNDYDYQHQSCDNEGKNDLFTNLNTFMIKY